MRWPWQKPELETRADSSYTDALVAAILANASGQPPPLPTTTGALETAAGLVGQAFMSAEVKARPAVADAFMPGCLAMISRALIRRGEIVLRIDTGAGLLKLLPAESHDVEGGPDPITWEYRISLGWPSRTFTYDLIPSAGVVHVRYAVDPETHWRGYGPLGVALLAGKLSASTVQALADEANMPHGAFLALPKDGDDPTLTSLKQDVKKAQGNVLFVESVSENWQQGGNAPRDDWETKRFGASPPAALVEQAELAAREVYTACGIPPNLAESSDGTGQREAWRRFLFGTVAPLGRIVSAELSEKLEDAVSLDWQELRASDISGRARAFQSMVGGGMPVEQAVAVAGLMVAE